MWETHNNGFVCGSENMCEKAVVGGGGVALRIIYSMWTIMMRLLGSRVGFGTRKQHDDDVGFVV